MRAVDAPPQNLAGDFDDLPLDMLAFPSRHLLGEPEDAVPRDEEGLPPWTALQTCTCANFGCGGIGAVITMDDRTVVWSDFADAPWMCGDGQDDPEAYGLQRRAAWRSLGPLHFDRRQYQAALTPPFADPAFQY